MYRIFLFTCCFFATSLAAQTCADLTAAIRAENVDRVKELLATVDANCTDPDPDFETIVLDNGNATWRRQYDHTPLVTAARMGNLDIARLLIAAGANVNRFHRHD
ncbi:MAG: ankyrin repeat domain-containing protein, partial [Bacteroidota bacterium]